MAGNILDRFKEVTQETVIDTTKKVRVGIIGTGWIAEAHMASYLKQPDVEVVAGADLVEGKAAKFFEKFGIEEEQRLIIIGKTLVLCLLVFVAALIFVPLIFNKSRFF